MRIGELAERAGVTTRTVRYYESLGLMPAADRLRGRHRLYGDGDLARLKKIDHLKRLGLTLDEVATVIDLYFSDGGTREAKRRILAILEGHLRETDERIEALAGFRDDLRASVERMRGDIAAPSD
jgi:MerR family copper efflux transcriptional regulator